MYNLIRLSNNHLATWQQNWWCSGAISITRSCTYQTYLVHILFLVPGHTMINIFTYWNCLEVLYTSCLIQIYFLTVCVFRSITIPPPNEVGGGVYWIHLVCPSVRPSVCRRHGFRSISQVFFRISISNYICMLMVAIGRSLLIFSDVTFKIAAWRPYWIFWFPDSNFTLALNINFKLQRHNTYVYW